MNEEMQYEQAKDIILEHMKDVILMTNIVENAKYLYDRSGNSTRASWSYETLKTGVRQLKIATDALHHMLEEYVKLEEKLNKPATMRFRHLLATLRTNSIPYV